MPKEDEDKTKASEEVGSASKGDSAAVDRKGEGDTVKDAGKDLKAQNEPMTFQRSASHKRTSEAISASTPLVLDISRIVADYATEKNVALVLAKDHDKYREFIIKLSEALQKRVGGNAKIFFIDWPLETNKNNPNALPIPNLPVFDHIFSVTSNEYHTPGLITDSDMSSNIFEQRVNDICQSLPHSDNVRKSILLIDYLGKKEDHLVSDSSEHFHPDEFIIPGRQYLHSREKWDAKTVDEHLKANEAVIGRIAEAIVRPDAPAPDAPASEKPKR